VAAAYYEYDGNLLRVGEGVLEQFSRAVLGSKRIPLAWVAVGLQARRHDEIRVEIGMAPSPESPFYSSPSFMEPAFIFDVPAVEEPRLRAFLDEAARSAGRA
jgi:hypothetical protein